MRRLQKQPDPGRSGSASARPKGRFLLPVLLVATALLLAFLYFPFRFGAWTEVDNGWSDPSDSPACLTSVGVPDAYERPCARAGNVVPFPYSVSKAGDPSRTAERTAYVYLPYGYDPEGAYDVLFLYHGSRDTAASWLLDDPVRRQVVDNLIDRKDIPPLLIVTPPLFSPDSFGYPDNFDREQIAYELREVLLPAVESSFACAAAGMEKEDARKHRAVAGLSRGAEAVFTAGLADSLDLFSRFGAFSGMLTDPYDVKNGIEREEFADCTVDLLFCANGFFDYTFYEHAFRMTVLDRISDRLTGGENCLFLLLRKGEHTWPSWEADLYNFLIAAYGAG